MRYTALINLLIILILTTSTKSEVVTTDNLLNQNFDSGSWSGTADGRHGSNVIASEHDTYIKSNDVSLKNDAGLTELQIQNGYTSNHEFKYWHWNTYNSTVKSTVTITGEDGETTTQIRTYNSDSCGSLNCGDYVIGSDTYTVLSNLQTDYELSVRYDFTDSSNATNNHYGVDLKEPSLTVTYESDPFVLDNNIRDEIRDVLEDFTPKEDLWIEEKFEFIEITNEPLIMKDSIITEEFVDFSKEEQFDEPKIIPEDNKEEPLEMTMEFFEEEKEETINVQEEESSNKESTTEIVSTENNSKQKKIQQKETIHITKVMEKIDAKVKNISKNLQIKNIVKLAVMTNNQVSLNSYSNTKFYKPKDIYLDQINIIDNRLIYNNVSLNQYTNNDTIAIKQRTLEELNINKQKILLEIKELKNG